MVDSEPIPPPPPGNPTYGSIGPPPFVMHVCSLLRHLVEGTYSGENENDDEIATLEPEELRQARLDHVISPLTVS